MAEYTEAQLEALEVPDKTGTENPPPREGDPRYTCHSEDRTGGACQMSSHKTGEVAYSFYHFNGSGFGYLPNGGAWAMYNNSFTKRTYGAESNISNGNQSNSYRGGQSNRFAECSTCSGPGGGPRKQGTPSARGTVKTASFNAVSQVYSGDVAMITPGTMGIAAQELNLRSIGNFTFGSVEGSTSVVGDGGASFGSKGATCQIGGKGVTLLAQGGPLSAESSGQMSLYTKGSNIIVDSGGAKIYMNTPQQPPKNVDDVTKETNKQGSSAVKSVRVRNKISNV